MTKSAGGGAKRGMTRKTAKTASAGKPATHILAAAKGPGTVSHRRIETAVEKVPRERSLADA
ncbi:MAG: hypothetical protein EXR07_20155 [Acetobacteraceae bacterium]|nr:hypothetical protein [Acetobacteraceae bacterium]